MNHVKNHRHAIVDVCACCTNVVLITSRLIKATKPIISISFWIMTIYRVEILRCAQRKPSRRSKETRRGSRKWCWSVKNVHRFIVRNCYSAHAQLTYISLDPDCFFKVLTYFSRDPEKRMSRSWENKSRSWERKLRSWEKK